MDGETLQLKTTHKGRKNSKLQDPQRQEAGGECIWNISEQIQGITGHHGAKADGCQRHYLLPATKGHGRELIKRRPCVRPSIRHVFE